MDTQFSAQLVEWRGPAPFYWFVLPEEVCDYVDVHAAGASYGWGAVPVTVSMSVAPRGGRAANGTGPTS